jgi:hypothetical protein
MIEKKNRYNFLSKVNVLFRICMSLIPLQATCYFTFNKSSISDLYTYFSRERESRKHRYKPIEMLGLDKDLYSRTTIYIPGLDNIRKTRCVLSLINPINKMYARCVYFYVVHTLNSVTKRSNTQLPEAAGLI